MRYKWMSFLEREREREREREGENRKVKTKKAWIKFQYQGIYVKHRDEQFLLSRRRHSTHFLSSTTENGLTVGAKFN